MKSDIKLPIYMDYQATTPMDKRVLEAMMPYFTEKFGNPHSRSHQYGWETEDAIETARKQIAALINASPKEVIFTSGATESNNLAIKGAAHFYGDKKKHIITVVTEHKCVLDACRHLEDEGYKVTYLKVNDKGIIDLQELSNNITSDTLMVSVMSINNELGVIQPLEEIGKLCREKDVFFHSDCAQSFGKIPLDVEKMNIDMMSISAHKIYGPKGVGALYVRKKPNRVRLMPMINGGGQERGMRSGTLPTPLIVGFGKASEIAYQEMAQDYAHAKKLADKLFSQLSAAIPDIYLNGDKEKRYPGCLNISFAYIEGESLMMAIRELAVSSGSACTSSSLEPSYVLRAIGVGEELAHTSIRFGIGRFTTEEEIDYATVLIIKNIEKLREMSPLWEMVQDGIDLTKINWAAH